MCHALVMEGERSLGFHCARNGLHFMNVVNFVFIELSTTFCVWEFIPAVPLVFALYLNQMNLSVVVADFYSYVNPFRSCRVVMPTSKRTNPLLSACMQCSRVIKEEQT